MMEKMILRTPALTLPQPHPRMILLGILEFQKVAMQMEMAMQKILFPVTEPIVMTQTLKLILELTTFKMMALTTIARD